ncbi:MAG: helix-turn-helix domain-containing protein [Methanobrevibacter sp.]|jgi:putative transposase|nr:helix-turn-helix domain-containing protein [Candidatus Methanovirga procula]
MSAGRKFVIENHLSIEDLDEVLKDPKIENRVSKRVIFIRMLMQGSTIIKASKSVGANRKTGSEWLKRYNKEGFKGLIPNFGGGRPGKLNDEQKEELKNILTDKKSNYTIMDTKQIIKDLYGVELSYNRVWKLVRVDFNLNI